MIRTLIWKEWRPLRWKLVFAFVLVGAFEAIALKTRILPDVGVYILSIMATMLLMPLFTAMGLFAAEREEGSLAFQVVLPVKTGWIYGIKMALGAAVSAAPLLFGMLIALTTAGREQGADDIVKGYLYGMLSAVLVFVWMTVFAIPCRAEAFVPLVYIALVSVWTVLVFIDEAFCQNTMLWRFSMKVTPFGVMECAMGDLFNVGGTLLLQVALAGGLFLWGFRRFNKLAGRLS
jgi:hypothetical protein